MKNKILLFLANSAAGALLVACGGGGDGGGEPQVATPTSISNAALAIPPNFDFGNFKTVAVKPTALSYNWTIGNPVKTFVTVWYVDASNTQRQVAFISWGALQALGSTGLPVQLPGNVTHYGYEIYEGTNSNTGEVKL